MNSSVGQTYHSSHFFIKHLSDVNLRVKGKREAPGELQGGGGTSSLCGTNKHTQIHSQPENKVSNENVNTSDTISNLVFDIWHRFKLTFLLPPALLSRSKGKNSLSITDSQDLNSAQIIHLSGEQVLY